MLSYTHMTEHSPGGSGLFTFWRGWRREIRRGIMLFAVVVVAGLAAFTFFRSFASGWSGIEMGDRGWMRHGEGEWHEAFVFTEPLAAGERVWIRNRSGAVIVTAAEGESLHVVAEKRWRRSSPDMVDVVSVPHEGGVTICALWEARFSECRAHGAYELRDVRRNDVMVRFTVHVPRGVAVDASAVRFRVARCARESGSHFWLPPRSFRCRRSPQLGRGVQRPVGQTTFCLIDVVRLEGNSNTPNRTYWDCFPDQHQGISAGWGDQYHWFLPGQSIVETLLFERQSHAPAVNYTLKLVSGQGNP